jgi:hypothetical protein
MNFLKSANFLLALSVFFVSCSSDSDETEIRKEFKIPDSAQLTFFKATPEESGWFGREGLKIDAYFQFNQEDFEKYLFDANHSNQWLPLPIPKDFLMKMLRIKSHKQGITNTYKKEKRPLPEEGSVYNSTEEQLFERGVKIIPVTGPNGIFILKSAGHDIMRMSKKTHTKLDKEINDFMLGILDFDQQKLFVKVSTSY